MKSTNPHFHSEFLLPFKNTASLLSHWMRQLPLMLWTCSLHHREKGAASHPRSTCLLPRDGAIPTSSFPALSLGLEFLSCQQQKDLEKLLFSWPILLEVIPSSLQELSHFCAMIFMREVKTPSQNQTCWQSFLSCVCCQWHPSVEPFPKLGFYDTPVKIQLQ